MAPRCVVVVDPYSTGCICALEAQKQGCQIIALWTKETTPEMKAHRPSTCAELVYLAEITESGPVADVAAAVTAAAGENEVCACFVGGESGVTLADELSEHLKLRTNGTQIPQRRDKKLQQELAKQAGLRSVRQAGGTKLEDVQEFLNSEHMPIVVKPVESAGSDGVKLCHTKEEATEHFKLLMGAQQKVGSQGAAVLCQEFLRGKEYVIDHVSQDGVHKTTMIWVYDKRPCNGAAFVYHGMIPIASDSKEAKVLVPYIRGVLDALQIKNGPTHGEAIWTDNGPCLVEMNCRASGGEGTWVPLARALTGGYTQVDVGVDCYLNPAKFSGVPDIAPSPFKAHGQIVYLVSFTEGKVTGRPGYDKIKKMSSLVHLEETIKVGSKIDRTVDLFTNVGIAVMMNASAATLKSDLATIWEMQKDCTLFDLEDYGLVLKRPRGDSHEKRDRADSSKLGVPEGRVRAMSDTRDDLAEPVRKVSELAANQVFVVVDPVTTGGCVAFEAFQRGFKVVALWSTELPDHLRTHVPVSCQGMVYHAELEEEVTIEGTGNAVRSAVGDYQLMGLVVGAETGVPLADALSEHLGLRTNGTQIPQRRDKKLQQELTKKAGLRSVRQAGGTTLSEVQEFLDTEQMPVVVKPVESAGSDGVKLCYSKGEAEEHFNLLMNSQQKIGSQDAAVLCQEFLRGKEYVVDHVSHDGVHKTVMIWVYDKRAVNGAAFVYHGMLPVPSTSPEAQVLVPYVRGVLDALQIKNGPTHGEVMMTPTGPCLVEMNCRSHGGEGTWTPLASALTGGYTQVTATIDAFLEPNKYKQLPDVPPKFKAAGQEVMLVSFTKGKVVGAPGFERIKALPSFVYLESSCDIGAEIDYTTDLFTNVGSVILMHKSAAVLEKDISEIRQMEQDCAIFELETSPVVLSRPRAESETKKTCEEIVAEDPWFGNNCAVM